jgi:3-oxoacyl-[acyl-carrier protein] reductase
MIEQRRGKIIMVNSSTVRRSPAPYLQVHYLVSKMGVLGLTRCLAAEFGPMGIKVNGFAPGYTPETEQAAELIEPALFARPGYREKAISNIPLRRFGHSEDYEGVVVFLASEESDYITGQTISVDGGVTM